MIDNTFIDKCVGFPDPTFFVFSSEVPSYLYYSHVPSIVLSVFFALFITFSAGKARGKWFVVAAMLQFALWVVSILVTWTNNIPSVIVFFWAAYGSLFVLMNLSFYFFVYAFSFNKYPAWWLSVPITMLALPVLILAPTKYNIVGFDMSLCGVGEFEGATYVSYYYLYGLALTILTGITTVVAYFKSEPDRRNQSVLVGVGAFLCMVALLVSSYVATLTEVFEIEKYGFIGLPIFLGYLTFVIVKYRAFDIRILSVQALVFLLMFLNFAVLFVRNISNARYIIVATMILTFVFGRYLIAGVKNEIAQRQRIGRLAVELQNTNDQQSNLMHFITHQIKGFFTKTRNISSMILEGDFGKYDSEIEKMLRLGIENDDRGVALVQELLNATNLKRGTVQYNMVNADMREIVTEAVEMVELSAKTKGLSYGADLPVNPVPVRCDVAFIKQALRNIVDNAVKYTPAGRVTIKLVIDNGFAVVKIVDTGIGFTHEDREKLFTEGGRGSQSRKINVESTGYGLYIVKNVIEQHGGHVDATSAGPGQGAVFTVTLPLVS
jgi:signal transduction histidine kinase